MRRATVSARDNALECSSLKSGSTFSSQLDSRTRRTCMPARSLSCTATCGSRSRSTTTRVSTKLAIGEVAPIRPSGCHSGASMKRSPWSEAASSASLQATPVRVLAITLGPASTAQASRLSAAQVRRRNNSVCSRLPARIRRGSGWREASARAVVSVSSLIRRSSSRAATPPRCTWAIACCSACLRSRLTALTASTTMAASTSPPSVSTSVRSNVAGPVSRRRRLAIHSRSRVDNFSISQCAGRHATPRRS